MDRGYLGGLANQIGLNPQAAQMMQQEGQVAPQQQQAQGYELPDKLAVRRQKLNTLLNNYGLYKQFLTEMSQKGIDPFQIDYGSDDGGLAFQAMLDFDSGIRYGAMELANERAAEDDLRGLEAQGKIRFNPGVNTQEDLAYSNPNNYYSTELDPRVVEANKRTDDTFYTNGEVNVANRQYFDRAVQNIMNDPTLSEEEKQYQIQGLQQAMKRSAASFYTDNGRRGRNNTPEIEILKKVTNLAQGVWPEGTYKVITKGGKALLENRTMTGEYLGDYIGQDAKGNQKIYKKIVKRWVKDPETGQVVIEFDNPEIPAENASNTKGDAIAAAVITNNPKYGSAPKMYATARELGFLDDTSSAINERLISQDANTLRAIGDEKAAAVNNNIKQKYDKARQLIVDMQGGFFTVPTGTLAVKKHRFKDKYYIDNWEDLGFKEEPNNLSVEDVIEYLDDYNYFDQFLDQQPSTQNVVNKGGKKAY